jgi:hypothetical protein
MLSYHYLLTSIFMHIFLINKSNLLNNFTDQLNLKHINIFPNICVIISLFTKSL